MNLFSTILVILIIGSITVIDTAKNNLAGPLHLWKYNNQKAWSRVFRSCSGNRQSPIPLPNYCTQTDGATVLDTTLGLEYYMYDTAITGDSMTMVNNGHSVQVTVTGSDLSVGDNFPKVTTQPDGNVYQFVQFHYHWDQNDTHGSEHSLHGVKEALEMHLVHFNTKYPSFSSASKKPDGLLVIAVLFDNQEPGSDPLNLITNNLNQIQVQGVAIPLTGLADITLSQFIPPLGQTFYTYLGSLTTPPCTQSVTWIIYPQLLAVSDAQLDLFQSLDNKENLDLGDTHRAEQPLNGRTLYVSNDNFCNN